MKRIFYTFFVLIITNIGMAQTTQNGVVKEYNEKKQKTPLAGVELIIKNAGSCVSDKKGLFSLKFRTLKPGDRVEYSRIEKSGYELFNKDAVEEWRIANDGSTFTIVLCKSSKFKALKDKYNAVASKSYAEQQKKEIAILEAQLKVGKIQQAEFQKKLNELKKIYDEQLENLDNYIDRFARIDLSELSKEEQKIIDLINDGKISEAISAYEDLGLEEQYLQAQSNINETKNAIKQLSQIKASNEQILADTYSAIIRMNDTRRLQGGENNYRKIGETLKNIMEADTMNFKNVSIYADFLIEQTNHTEAIYYLSRAFNLTTDMENKAGIMQRLGSEYMRVGKIDDCERCLRNSEKILDSIQLKMDKRRKDVLYGVLYRNLADVYNTLHDLKQAEEYYKRALAVFPSENLSNKDVDRLLSIMINFGTLYTLSSRSQEAIALLIQADSLLNATYSPEFKEKQLHISSVLNNQLATAYGNLKQYEESHKYFSKTAELASTLTKINPQAYSIEELYIQNNWGGLCLRQKKYAEAESHFQIAYNVSNQLATHNQSIYNRLLCLIVGGSLGQSKVCQSEKWQQGKDILDRILPEMLKIHETNKLLVVPYLSILYIQCAYAYMHHLDYENALGMVNKAIELTPENANCYDSKGEILYNSGDVSAAKEMWDKVIEINSNYLENNESELYKLLFEK